MYTNPFKQIRSNVIAGVLIITPLVTTLYVILKIFSWIDSILPSFLHALLPVIPDTWMFGTGFIVILLVSYFIGVFATNWLGQKVINFGNSVISSIPLLNKIYLGIQQILDSVARHKKGLFDRPVLIEYPKKNSYSIAFVTAETSGEIPKKADDELLSLFVPTTPNPTSGFLLFVPKSEVIDLDMSVETAVKTVMSAGMVNPDIIRETNHMYMSESLKHFEWFKWRPKSKTHDPRD